MPSPRSSVAVDQDRVRREVIEVIAEQMGRGTEELTQVTELCRSDKDLGAFLGVSLHYI